MAKAAPPKGTGERKNGSKRKESLGTGAQSGDRALGPCRGYRGTHCKGQLVGPAGEKASPRSCNTLFLQCAALGLGEGEEGNSCQGAESPTRPAHREGVVYVEGNLPPLEGELLFPVPAHCHQSRHRPRRCRCHRHHLLPAAAAAAAAPAAGASSQLLPATAKRRELQHPPPRSTFATGGREKSRRGPESRAAFPITRFHTRSANQRRARTGPAPSRRGPSPPPTAAGRPPVRVQRRGGRDCAASGPPQPVTGALAPEPPPRGRPPPPGSPELTPFSLFLGAPRPASPLGCSCPVRPRPWEG